MSLLSSSLSFNSMALASAAGSQRLLTSTALGPWLNAFHSQPDVGQLTVPIVTPDPAQASGFQIAAVPLTRGNAVQTIRMIKQILAELPRDAHGMQFKLTQLSEDWVVSFKMFTFLPVMTFSRPGRRIKIMSNSCRDAARIVVEEGYEAANVRQSVLITESHPNRFFIDSYCFRIESVLVESLCTYLNLPTNAPLEVIAHALPAEISFEAGVQRSEDPVHEPMEGALELESQRVGQTLGVHAGLDPSARRRAEYSERIHVWLTMDPEHDGRMTPEQLKFWNWVRSRIQPSAEETAAYLKRTEARYRATAGHDPSA